MYLLDTNVVSELRRTRPHGAIIAWLRSIDERLIHISAMTVGEIQAAIEVTREHDSVRAGELALWLDRIVASLSVLNPDARVFRVWATLMHRRPDDLFEDALIAATASVNNLTVVTRNLRDFDLFGMPTLNPFDWRD